MAIIVTVDGMLLGVLHDVHVRIRHRCRVLDVFEVGKRNDKSLKLILLIIEVIRLIGLFVKEGLKTSRMLKL